MSLFDNILHPDATLKIPRTRRFLVIVLMIFLIALIVTGYIISEEFVGIVGVITFLAFGIVQTERFLLSMYAIRPLLDQFVGVSFLDVGPLSLNIGTILGGSTIFIALFYLLMRRFSFFKYKFVLPAFLFLLVNIISIFVSRDFLAGVNDWFRICSWIIILIWVVTVFDSEEKIDKLTKACVFAAIISVCVILLQRITGGGHYMYGQEIEQRFGWFVGPNAAGLVLLGTFPFVLFRTFQLKGLKQFFYLVLIVAVAMSVFFTFFRTNWIIFIIQILVMVVLKRKQMKASLFVFVLILVVSGFLGTTQRYAVEERFDDFYYLEETNPLVHRRAGSGRYGIWQDNIDAFAEAPLFTKMIGRGMKGSIIVSGREAHNDFIGVLSNNGIIGLIIYLWFLYTLFNTGRQLSKTATSPYHQNIASIFWIVFISWLARAILTGTILNPNGMWYVAAVIGITNTALVIQNKKQGYPNKSIEA